MLFPCLARVARALPFLAVFEWLVPAFRREGAVSLSWTPPFVEKVCQLAIGLLRYRLLLRRWLGLSVLSIAAARVPFASSKMPPRQPLFLPLHLFLLFRWQPF